MGFGQYIGGIILGIVSVLLLLFGLATLLGVVPMVPANLSLPLGIVIIVVALVLLLYGWYSYQSAKPKGTVNVHNV